MTIERGTIVEATTARGNVVQLRALGGPVRGFDFPVVWVCTEEEYRRSTEANDEPDGLPWPLDALGEPHPA
jgi:hypothetical protein